MGGSQRNKGEKRRKQPKPTKKQYAEQKRYAPLDAQHTKQVTWQKWAFRATFVLCCVLSIYDVWSYDYEEDVLKLFFMLALVGTWAAARKAFQYLALTFLSPRYPDSDDEVQMLGPYMVLFRRGLYWSLLTEDRVRLNFFTCMTEFFALKKNYLISFMKCSQVLCYVALTARATNFGAAWISPPKESKDYVDAALVYVLPRIFSGVASLVLLWFLPFYATMNYPVQMTSPKISSNFPAHFCRVPNGVGSYTFWYRYGWVNWVDVIVCVAAWPVILGSLFWWGPASTFAAVPDAAAAAAAVVAAAAAAAAASAGAAP